MFQEKEDNWNKKQSLSQGIYILVSEGIRKMKFLRIDINLNLYEINNFFLQIKFTW